MNLGFEPKLSDFPECAFDDYTTLLHLWALHANHLCGARCVCFLEPEQSCGVYGKDGDAEARNSVTRKELGMGQRREGAMPLSLGRTFEWLQSILPSAHGPSLSSYPDFSWPECQNATQVGSVFRWCFCHFYCNDIALFLLSNGLWIFLFCCLFWKYLYIEKEY